MAQRKPFNPNTKYGRKKIREQYYENYNSMSSKEKDNHNSLVIFLTIISIIVFGGLILLIGGPEALLKWLSH